MVVSGSGAPLVWITRPQPGADKTAAALADAGYNFLVLPLTEIVAFDPEIDPGDIERADFVVATSANAFRFLPEPLLAALADKPVYAVGDATRAEALARGFVHVRSADGAVDDLVSLVSRAEPVSARFVYLCGKVRTGDLEHKLVGSGFEGGLAIVYSSKIVSRMTYLLTDALSHRRPDAILFHSALSARAFADAVSTKTEDLFENTRFIAISARVADALPDTFRPRVMVATAPNEHALLEALRATVPSSGA
ncbi:uroporphyrinogen-III synthase [Oricola indica]|uniref:uroporphyrinogen-III synthase n=1 Tax=Oricola indica TaxID=2872591 RepID=UPI0030840303